MYTISFKAEMLAAPVDSTVYYVGDDEIVPATTDPLLTPGVRVIRPGNILAASVNLFRASGGIAPTSEAVVVAVSRYRAGAETAFQVASLGLAAGVAPQATVFENLELLIPVLAVDLLRIKITTPAWVTNPTNLTAVGEFYLMDDAELSFANVDSLRAYGQLRPLAPND